MKPRKLRFFLDPMLLATIFAILMAVVTANAAERSDRAVDEAALASQDQSIRKLSTLAKKYRGTSREPILLAKLAELQQEKASIQFRIAHGMAHRSGRPLSLARHHESMRASIETISTLLKRYPRAIEAAHATYLRGHAFEEIEDRKSAADNYLRLLRDFPDSEDFPAASMSLAEFAIAANQHEKAIGYLKPLERDPSDPHYPFALYKLAWAHYNLKHVADALAYAEKHVRYLQPLTTSSDIALRENTLLDSALFYFEGIESKAPDYGLENALAYFRKLEKGRALGKMAVRLSKLLRSHGLDKELAAFKTQFLSEESDRPEGLDLLLIAFEHQMNKREFDRLAETSREIVRFHARMAVHAVADRPDFARAEKMMLDTASTLQGLVIKNKGASGLKTLSASLAAIYDSFVQLVPDSDPRVPRVHFNLAETWYAISEFEQATQHYRWVVEHRGWSDRDPVAGTRVASLRAISSHYQSLKAKKLLPETLAPVAFSENRDADIHPMQEKWISWIDRHLDHIRPDDETADAFAFDAARILYSARRIREATDRLKDLARRHPHSSVAFGAVSLVIDTGIASADWQAVHDYSAGLLASNSWKNREFASKLFAVASQASYKQIELAYAKKDYGRVLDGFESYRAKYSRATQMLDALLLTARSSQELGDLATARKLFSDLLDLSRAKPASLHFGQALLARAAVQERSYFFREAAQDYIQFLALPHSAVDLGSSELARLREKSLTLAWMTGDAATLKLALSSPGVCPKSNTCSRFEALLAHLEPARDTRALARDSSGEIRAIWAAAALRKVDELSFRDRLQMARFLAAEWSELEPAVRLSLLPQVSRDLPRAIALNRMAMNEYSPLRANEKSITRRIEAIRDLEGTAARVMKLPWARIRAGVLNEIASVYGEFASELTHLSPPQGMSPEESGAYEETIRKIAFPFEEKGQEMRRKALEIAARFAIEEETYYAIADRFFAENPSQSRQRASVKGPRNLDFSMIDHLDGSLDWQNAKADRDDLRTLWIWAVKLDQWPQAAFFLQEMASRKILPASMLGALQGFTLARAGARGEGLEQLRDAARVAEPTVRATLLTELSQYYDWSCSSLRNLCPVKPLEAELPAKVAMTSH